MKRVLIIGVTSRIAQETGRLFAESGARMVVTGRDVKKLSRVISDLRTRGAEHVDGMLLDAMKVEEYQRIITEAIRSLGGMDVALIAHGMLPVKAEDQENADRVLELLQVNAVSVLVLVTLLTKVMIEQRYGCIAVISSVAGDRGRASNYAYGAAKGAVSIFLEGLRMHTARKGVSVLTVKPGIVDTPMTEHVGPWFLKADPSRVGRRIFRAIQRKERVVYVPWYWRWISLTIRHLPGGIIYRIK